MLPTKFRFIWPSGFRGEDLQKSANQKQDLHVTPMFVTGSGPNVQGVSEEKIKMWKVNGRQTTSDSKNVKSVQMLETKCWQYLIRSFGSGDLKPKEN